MRNSLIFWTSIALLAAVTACKPPRSPRERAEGSVTGQWTAESVAPGAPRDTGRVAWRLALEEREAGKLAGDGSMTRGADAAPFPLSGVRGESDLTLYFDLPGERVKYHGGIVNPKTITGELYLPNDTIPLTFTRH